MHLLIHLEAESLLLLVFCFKTLGQAVNNCEPHNGFDFIERRSL